MKIIYFDAVGGVAGDMLAASLLALGDYEERLRNDLQRLPLPGWQMQYWQAEKSGFAAWQLEFSAAEEQPHRHLHDILALTAAAGFAEAAQAKIAQTFTLLAEAEGAVHGMPPEKVHFHEVGAVDTILDICAVCLLLHYLQAEAICASPLPIGHGRTVCAHGVIPLPAPAVAQMLAGVAIRPAADAAETVTPTGLALLKAHDCRFGALPAMTVTGLGVGCGQRDLSVPNMVRAFAGDSVEPTDTDEIYTLETTVDDMTGEQAGYLWEILFQAGARDLTMTPLQMKKGRPGLRLQVLTSAAELDAVCAALFAHTSSFGMICRREHRFVLRRRIVAVETEYGVVHFKEGCGYGTRKAAPEHEDLRKIAKTLGLSLAEVAQVAQRAYERSSHAEGSSL